MRARFLIAPLVGLALFLAAAPASAEGRPPEDDAYIDQDDNPTVEVGDGDDGESGDDGSSGGGEPCVWEVVIADDFASHVYHADGTIEYSETGRWLQKVCPGVGAVQVGGRFLIPEGGVVDVEALAQQARASIGISGPVIRTSPEAGNRLYVRVPTWLWVDGDWWQSYSAAASAGRVTATVSAQPVAASWTFGDGGSTSCSGPGVAWRAGLPEDATDCSHTFTTSSAGQPDGTFGLSATVTLEVSWTSNIGSGGALSPISRSSSQAVEVGEIQAIGTGG
jgi:hypothetical protein